MANAQLDEAREVEKSSRASGFHAAPENEPLCLTAEIPARVYLWSLAELVQRVEHIPRDGRGRECTVCTLGGPQPPQHGLPSRGRRRE